MEQIKSKAYVSYEDYVATHPELKGVEKEAEILQDYEEEFFNLIIRHCG